MPSVCCLRLLCEEAARADCLAWAKTGKRMAARIAIIAITTSSSISVKPGFSPLCMVMILLKNEVKGVVRVHCTTRSLNVRERTVKEFQNQKFKVSLKQNRGDHKRRSAHGSCAAAFRGAIRRLAHNVKGKVKGKRDNKRPPPMRWGPGEDLCSTGRRALCFPRRRWQVPDSRD